MIGIDNFIKDIIEKLMGTNNYNVMEINTNAGLESNWIAVKDKEDFYNVLIFSSNFAIKNLDKEYIEEYIKSLLADKPINLNIAILMDEEMDGSFINSLDGNLIKDISFIVDYNNRNIVYAGEGTRNIVEDIVSVPEQRENIYYNENDANSNKKLLLLK